MNSRFAAALLLAVSASAQIPAQDSRNTYIPNTDTHFTPPTYKTLAEWQARREHLRKQILSAAGLLPMPAKTPLHPQIFGRIENQTYSIEKVLLETMPGYYLGGNLYRPLQPAPPGGFPAIASPHGHWNYGRLENTDVASVPARCINLARQGYVVFAYDMVGYDDTVQTPHDFATRRDNLWDFGPLPLQLWNSIRVVDFLESLPGVNPHKIGATGASGGGTQTFLLAAVDDRVAFDAPVNMLSTIMQGGSPCENTPNLRFDTFNVEFGAIMAPRPMMMVSATGDWTRNTPREEYPAIKAIYELYDRAANVEMVQIQAPHNYNKQSREAVYRFFGHHILGETDDSKLMEKSYRVEKLGDMLALFNRKLPENALDLEGVRREWTERGRAAAAHATPQESREMLALALGAEWPKRVIAEMPGERFLLTREGRGDRVAGFWLQGQGTPIVFVHPDGAEAARKSPEFAALVKEGRPIYVVEAFQTGSAVAPRKRDDKMFLTFNRTDDAARVQDILTTMAWLKPASVELVGVGKAAIWCQFAAAVAQVPVTLKSDPGSFKGSDEDFLDSFFVPGIQRAGGLAAAKALTK
jgi:dienelactone hydrolase